MSDLSTMAEKGPDRTVVSLLREAPDIGRQRIWKLVSTVTGMLSGLLARKLMRAAYQAIRKDAAAPSPFDPTARDSHGQTPCCGRPRPASASALPGW